MGASGLPLLQKLAELAARQVPVVTFNSDIPAGDRMCYVGEDAHRAGRIAGLQGNESEVTADACRRAGLEYEVIRPAEEKRRKK